MSNLHVLLFHSKSCVFYQSENSQEFDLFSIQRETNELSRSFYLFFVSILINFQQVFELKKSFSLLKVGKDLLDFGRKTYSKDNLKKLKNDHPELGKILLKDFGMETGKICL